MKDMYSFDISYGAAMEAYNDVRSAYDWFFQQIGLPFVTVLVCDARLTQVEADGGTIGGTLCHEYHYVSQGSPFLTY
jgi:prolyl-tRNA synthetase